MTRIMCLHTADIHTETFGKLFAASAAAVEVTHIVRPEWLAEARAVGLTDHLRATVTTFLAEQSRSYDAVLCSCSTLGPIAEATPTSRHNIIRIDAPLMHKATAHDGCVILALCLESTRLPTEALLQAAFARNGKPGRFITVLCADAWPHFERGEKALFGQKIATQIVGAISKVPDCACIVLAQASMAVAEPLLKMLGVPVYASPSLAVAETLRVAGLAGTGR